jgi:ABC-type branched-subunit amino acid transport system ATPase component
MANPKILLFEEPSLGLGTMLRQRQRETLKQINISPN